tara:strand:+ start:52 stop:276 length:225 start_codon:yes stop_codon:yes gene_type:complete
MLKNFYYNSSFKENSLKKNNSTQIRYSDQKKCVDINELLDRIKIDKKKEIKHKLLFLGLAILPVSFIGVLLISF